MVVCYRHLQKQIVSQPTLLVALKFSCSKQIILIEHGFHLKTSCGA